MRVIEGKNGKEIYKEEDMGRVYIKDLYMTGEKAKDLKIELEKNVEEDAKGLPM